MIGCSYPPIDTTVMNKKKMIRVKIFGLKVIFCWGVSNFQKDPKNIYLDNSLFQKTKGYIYPKKINY